MSFRSRGRGTVRRAGGCIWRDRSLVWSRLRGCRGYRVRYRRGFRCLGWCCRFGPGRCWNFHRHQIVRSRSRPGRQCVASNARYLTLVNYIPVHSMSILQSATEHQSMIDTQHHRRTHVEVHKCNVRDWIWIAQWGINGGVGLVQDHWMAGWVADRWGCYMF